MPSKPTSLLEKFLGHKVLPKSKTTSRSRNSTSKKPPRYSQPSESEDPIMYRCEPQQDDENEDDGDDGDDEDQPTNVTDDGENNDAEEDEDDGDDSDGAPTEYDGPSAAADRNTWIENSNKHFEESLATVRRLIQLDKDHRNAINNIPPASKISAQTLEKAHNIRRQNLTRSVTDTRNKGKFCMLMNYYAPGNQWTSNPRIPDDIQCDALGTLSLSREDPKIDGDLRIPPEVIASANALLSEPTTVLPGEHLRVISSQFPKIRAIIERTPEERRPASLVTELERVSTSKTQFGLYQAAFPLIWANKDEWSANYGIRYRKAQQPPSQGTQPGTSYAESSSQRSQPGQYAGTNSYAPNSAGSQPPPGSRPYNHNQGTAPPQSSYAGSNHGNPFGSSGGSRYPSSGASSQPPPSTARPTQETGDHSYYSPRKGQR